MNLFTAPSLDALAGLLQERLSNSPSNPLDPTTIVVQSKGMEQYLKRWLVKTEGIVANMEFPFPFHLIKNFKELVAEDSSLGKSTNLFEPLHSRWTMTAILSDFISQSLNKSMGTDTKHPLQKLAEKWKGQTSLNKPGKHRVNLPLDFFQFAFRLANLFDQYDFYRSDVLVKWEQATPNHLKNNWQARFWKKLREKNQSLGSAFTRKEELAVLVHSLKQKKAEQSKHPTRGIDLPKKLSIFAISYLPFCYLDFLNELSSFIEIDYYQLDTVGNTVGPILESEVQPKSSPQFPLADYFFKLLGQQSIDFRKQISQLQPTIDRHDYIDPPDLESSNFIGILPFIQKWFYHQSISNDLKDSFLLEDKKWLDLQIHECPSKRREVEVLKNNLWSLIDGLNENIGLDDILVLAQDIDEYTPYINALFPATPSLDYRTTDHRLSSQSIIFKELKIIFQFFNSQFEKSLFLEVIEGHLWRQHWQLDDEELREIKKWLDQTNYRWGRAETDNLYNLYTSLSKLVTAYCINTNIPHTNNTHISGASLNLSSDNKKYLVHLLNMVHTLLRYDQRIKKPKAIPDWIELVERLIKDCYFDLDNIGKTEIATGKSDAPLIRNLKEDLEQDLSGVMAQLEKIGKQVADTQFKAEVDLSTFQWILENSDSDSQSHGFMEGKITFASMLPMRAIPFKVIALLGMNDFPRNDKNLSFSYLQDEREGDRSRKKDDELLFLETLLSTQKTLHISYIGHALSDHSPLLPSALVSNLILVLAELTGLPPLTLKQRLTLEHPLRSLPIKSNKSGFFYKNYAKSDHQLYEQYQRAAETPKWIELIDKNNNLLENLDVLKQSFLNEGNSEQLVACNFRNLKQAFKNPLAWFVKHRLQADVKLDSIEHNDTEPLELSSLDRYGLLQSIKTSSKADLDFTTSDQLTRQERIMAGEVSVIASDKLEKKFNPTLERYLEIIGRINRHKKNPKHSNSVNPNQFVQSSRSISNGVGDIWAFDLVVDDIDELIQVEQMHNGVQVFFRNITQKTHDVIAAFINHIALSFHPNYKGTVVINHPFENPFDSNKENQKPYLLYFIKLSVEEAQTLWQHYRNLFELATIIPLPLLNNDASVKIYKIIFTNASKEDDPINEITKIDTRSSFVQEEDIYIEDLVRLDLLLERPEYVAQVYKQIFLPILKYARTTDKVNDFLKNI